MAYSDIYAMASSPSLLNRIAAAAASEGIDNPYDWTRVRMWQLAASPGWADDWAYAVATSSTNVNPDTGARSDVIDDSQILAAVQSLNVPDEA